MDLGISLTSRDEYFTKLLESCQKEFKEKGIILDLKKTEDILLLSDFAAWRYRKRTENVPLSQNLSWRIRNRIVKVRASYEEVTS